MPKIETLNYLSPTKRVLTEFLQDIYKRIFFQICKNDVEKRRHIEQCHISAQNTRFKLTDLLSVPVQRVMKYHILLQTLLKKTDTDDKDRPGLSKVMTVLTKELGVV